MGRRCRPGRASWKRALAVTLITLSGAVVLPAVAGASFTTEDPPLEQVPHPELPPANGGVDWFHRQTWPDSLRHDIEVRFTTEVPEGAFRERVKDGFAEWERLGAVSFTYGSDIAPRSEWWACDDLDDGQIVVQYGERDGGPIQGALASTINCRAEDDYRSIRASNIIFDEDELWSTSDTDVLGLGPTAYDVEGIAVHEIGHAVGFYQHFLFRVVLDIYPWPYIDNECTPGPLTWHTMCETAFPGVTWMRTLEWHEEQLHLEAYGPS